MKTIANKLRFALLLGLITMSLTVLAQVNTEKMTVSTLMFLDEMAGKISFDEPGPMLRGGDVLITDRIHHRPIASPDTIDGKVYISAFVRVTSDNDINALEDLGVLVMCKFDDGLMTANIPIDKIEDVAAIPGVINIEVGETMEVETDLTRQDTNVDDILTLSQDATIAGLQKKYDGSGVILGIVDSGIDFNHIAFKDKNGNNRIKRAYAYNGSSETDWTGSGSMPNDGVTNSDHGTHTSSIAGGSSVIINGTNVTVTDDHANATYGGMAPGADLYLAGVNGLVSTYTSRAMQKMCNYADEQGKPLVVSNSWSNSYGPRDGQYGGGAEQVVAQLFGDSHPNRICLFASANRAGNADPNEGGGLYATGTSSSSNPMGSIVRCHYYSNTDCGYYYSGTIVDAWARTPNVSLACKIYVLNSSTGAILKTVTLNAQSSGSSTVSGLSDYYDGTFTAYWSTNSNTNKRQFRLYASGCKTTSRQSTGSGYTSDYTLAVEVYPSSGSCIVDMWGGGDCYYTNYLTTSGHNWILGSDDVSVSDHAIMPQVISVGSYKTRDGYSSNSVGDISPFSGYAVEGVGPLGTQQPWITAPGEVVISAYNHLRTNRSSDPLVNNPNYPYGTAQGTSMATPAAAGIVALWMQAATECGKVLTLSEVKNIMKVTAKRDSWVTSGANASHFGNGKIDALAGINYILSQYAVPSITADPTTVTFEGEPGNSYTQTVAVSGLLLNGDITATLNDPNGVYSISTTNLGSGGNLVITFSPSVEGSYPATITLTSPGVDPVTVTINSLAAIRTDITVCDNGNTNEYLPVYGYYYDEAQVNQMLYPATKFANSGMSGNKITKLTFYPTSSGNYSGINFYYQASRGNGTVTVKLANMPSGTAGYAYTAAHKNADFITVKTITMPSSAQTGLTEWVFDDLETEFIYEGGDLLIEVTTEVGMYGHTYFAGETQSSYTGYYSYGSTSRGQQFLPKLNLEWESVVPITAGTVSPDALTFTDVRIGRSDEGVVTVTNTGNQPFTPVIDTANLPAEFAVTGGGQVLPNGTLDLTVTYTPTDEGPHSGSFTVTIGDVTYTVTVTGNGYVPNNTLYSNEVMVPVYKTDLDVYGPYTYGQVIGDTNRELAGNVTNGMVKVQAKNIDAITDYRLFHNVGAQNNTTNMDNWASGNNQSSVAYAVHNIANDNFTTYAMNGNAWTQDAVFTFQNGEEEMWIDLHDNIEVGGNVDTWYVPVTVASSKLGNENTYGSRMELNPKLNGSVIVNVGYDDSSEHREYFDDATGKYYVYVTAQAEIIGEIPTIEINGHGYECVMARAWRYYKPYIIGQGTSNDFVLELIGENTEINGENGIVSCVIGSDSWTETNSNDAYQFNEYTFCVEDGKQTDVIIYGRLYYKRSDVVNPASGLRLSGSDGGYSAMDGESDMPEEPTAVNEYFSDKELVDITFVNPQGMISSRPFEGVNIVVKRYSDGSTSTSKVLKR